MRSCLLLLSCSFVAFAGSVEGTVTNAVTGTAIKRATVTLMSQTRRARYIAGADDLGRFQFPEVEAATDWVVGAQARGFTMPPETRQSLKERAPFAIATQEQVKGITVKLLPLAAITGRVLDNDGDPVRGVTVQALQYHYRGSGRRLDIRSHATTDVDGRYRLYSVEPGRYLLRAYLHETPPGPAEPSPHVHNFVPEDGLPASYYPGAPEAAGASVLQVNAAAELTGYDFRLTRTPAFHISGHVEGADAKTKVVLAPCSTPAMDYDFVFRADMLRDGAFEARGITPGRYCLAAEHSGGGRVFSADAEVSVTDRHVNGVRLIAEALVAVQGSVHMDPDSAERPKPMNIGLADLDTPGLYLAGSTVKDDGTFSMAKVRVGPAELHVNGKLGESYLKSFRFGDRAAPGPFEIPRAGGTLTLVMGTDAGQISGRVQDQEGNPGDHMLVTIAPAGALAGRADLIRTAATSDDGKFELKGVAPGDYAVFAWESVDESATRSAEFLKLFTSKSAAVTVPAGAPATVQVKAVRAAEMEEATWKGQQ